MKGRDATSSARKAELAQVIAKSALLTARPPVDVATAARNARAAAEGRHPAAHASRCYGSAGCVCSVNSPD